MMKVKPTVFLFLVGIFFTSNLWGQDSLLTRALGEVMVVATRLPANLMRSTRSVYKSDLLTNNRGNANVAMNEAVLYVPGVLALNPLNFAQDVRLSIRGFGSRSAFGIRGIKVMVDGIPATTPDGQTQLDHVDMQQISSLEVVNGAAAGLYGNASGGMLSLTSRTVDRNEVRLGVKGGSFGYLRTNVAVHRVSDDWTFKGEMGYNSIDGYRDHSGSRSFNARSSIHRMTKRGSIKLLVDFVKSPKADDPGGIDLAQVMDDRSSARARNLTFGAGESVQQAILGLTVEMDVGKEQKAEAKGYFIHRDFANFLPFQSGGAVNFTRGFGGLQLKYTLEKSRNRLLVGMDAEQQIDDRKRFDNLSGQRGQLVLDQKEIFRNLAWYFLYNFRLSERLHIDITSRIDLLSSRAKDQFLTNGDQSGSIHWNHLSPSLGLNYALGSEIYGFGRIAHSFETPALSELSSNPAGGGGFNNDLQPQKANHYELGLKGMFGRSTRCQLSLFHIDLRQELVPYELADFPGRTFYRNAGSSQREGIEIGLVSQLTDRVRTQLAYTYSNFMYSDFEIDGEQYGGMDLPGIPKHFGSIGFQYGGGDGIYGALDTRYTSAIYLDDSNSVEDDDYLVMHARLGWRFLISSSQCDLHLGLRNITGTRYHDNIRINAFGGRYYEPAPPHFFFIGAEMII